MNNDLVFVIRLGFTVVLAGLGFFMQIQASQLKGNEVVRQGLIVRGMILVVMALIILNGKWN